MDYSSKASFLGLPLLEVRTGRAPGRARGVAGAWVAIGDVALGVLFAALGGLAVARDYAEGGIAVARHANDGVARGLLAGHPLFGAVRPLFRWSWILLLLPAVLIPLLTRLQRRG